MSTILVTGGAGFIGSHTVVELIQAGHTPVIIDNLCNASPKVIGRIAEITGHIPAFYQGDIRDRELLRRIFAEHPIQSVIHFAALKAVGESVKKPLEYYGNNVSGSLILLEEMQRAGSAPPPPCTATRTPCRLPKPPPSAKPPIPMARPSR